MTDELLEAEAALRRLILIYARGADRLDGALVRSVFADDAEIDLGAIYRGGPDGFAGAVLDFMSRMAGTRHQVANVLVEIDAPGQAGMEAYVTAWHRVDGSEGPRILEVLGRYLTRAERRGGSWLITHHTEVIDWGEWRPADFSWFDVNEEMEKGRRDPSDRSYSILRQGRG